MILCVFLLFTSSIVSAVSPFTKPNGDFDPAALTSHVLHLEQTVSDLQSHSLVQEQKQAAVLSSVLSKLTSTTEELSRVQAALRELEKENNSTLLELKELRSWKLNVETTLASNNYSLQLFENELTFLRSSHNETSCVLIELGRQVQNNSDNLFHVETDLDSVRSQNTLTEKDLVKSIVNTTNEFLSNSVKTEAELNATRGELYQCKSLIESTVIRQVINMTTEMNVIGRRVDVLERNLAEVINSTDQTVFFKAEISTRTSSPVNTTLIFDQVEINAGGGYNSTSGVFVAPVSGIYLFDITVQTVKDGVTGYELWKNGIMETEIFVRNSFDTGSSTTMFHVNKGDRVFVTKLHDSLASLNLEQYFATHYSGLLLHAD